MDSEYYREKEYLNEPELPSNTITLVELDDIRWAIRTHAPLMSATMLDKIVKSIVGRERTFREQVYYEETFYMQDGDRYLVEVEDIW